MYFIMCYLVYVCVCVRQTMCDVRIILNHYSVIIVVVVVVKKLYEMSRISVWTCDFYVLLLKRVCDTTNE